MADNPAWKNPKPGPGKKDGSSEPAWKQSAKGADGVKGEGPRAWQNRATERPARVWFSRTMQRLSVAVMLLGLIGGFVFWLIYIRPQPQTSLVLMGSSYDVNLAVPHNAYGWHGLQGMKEQLVDSARLVDLIYPDGGLEDIKSKKAWDEIWKLMPHKAGKAVIVSLGLHGGADDKGAYLFLGYPAGQDKVYMKDVLHAVTTAWPKQDIVLALEPVQVPFQWSSGILRNDFIQAVKKEIDPKKYPKLYALCACDEQQVSWSSEEYGRTVFSQFLIQGLLGAADQDENKNIKTKRVTLDQLFTYVKGKVANWAKSNKGVAQTPILLGGENRDIDLVHFDKVGEVPVPARKQVPSRELQEKWKVCEGFRDQVPSPTTYTPHLWRVYRDALIRWEQLERAGAFASSLKLKETCENLEKEIALKARADLGNRDVALTLPLPSTLGLLTAPARARAKVIDEEIPKLWKDEDKKRRAKQLQDLLGRFGVAADKARTEQGKLFYAQLCRQFLYYLKDKNSRIDAKDLQPGTSKARVILSEFEDVFKIELRPEEVHYLVMLLEDLAPKALPPLNVLQQALEVRLLAEEAALGAGAASDFSAADGGHPYSEIVFAWIKPQVESADQDRRLGEDWLFGKGPDDWKNAQELFQKAASGYKNALLDARAVRKALELRDAALAELPYYAQWLAQRRLLVDDKRAQEELEGLVDQVEEVSKNVGKLAWCLNETSFQGVNFNRPQDKSATNLEGLAPKKMMERYVTKLDKELRDPRLGLNNKFKKIRDDLVLKEVHNRPLWHELEAVLSMPVFKDREKLLAISRNLSIKFNETNQKSVEEKIELVEVGDNRQKRLALATAVPDWRADHPLAGIGDQPMTEVEAKIEKYWRELPGAITTELETSCEKPTVEEAVEPMYRAAFASRLLPGGLVPLARWNEQELPYGPAQGLRDLRLHDLLLWLAKRAEQDHWYKEGTAALRQPYYRPAAQAFGAMAQLLAKKGIREPIASQRALVARKFDNVAVAGLKIPKASSPDWTSETSFPVTWNIEGEPGTPAGLPMSWLELDPDGPLQASPNQFVGREAAKDWRSGGGYPRRFALQRVEKADEPENYGRATFVALFRGQKIEEAFTPKLWPPETIVNYVPPEKAGAAFRLENGFHYGAISIVLDCSLSMLYKENYIKNKPRFYHATQALKRMLETIPENTWVSLVVFVKPARKGGSPFEFLRLPDEWKPGQEVALIRKVEQIPEKDFLDYTPLADAIVESLDKGFPERYKGPKLIVTLTDGDDNSSFKSTPEKFTQVRHNMNVKTGLRNSFADSNKTELQIICFNEQKDPESKNAKEQFEEAVKLLDPPGNFHVQPDPEELAKDLELAIRPRLVLKKDKQVVRGYDERPINRYDAGGLDWRRLEPGDYTAHVKNAGPQDIHIEPGELLIFTLTRDPRDQRISWQRSLFADERSDKKIADGTKGGFLVALLQNQIDKDDTVRQLFTLETADKKTLREQSPGFVWIETKAKGPAQRAGLVTWQRDFRFPAPAFRAEIQNWPMTESSDSVPDPAPAAADLWWTLSPKSLQFSSMLEGVKVALDPRESLPIKHHFKGSKNDIIVESVGWEGTKLVVRIKHDPQKPVFVQLGPLPNVEPSQEHRFYTAANKYTASFAGLANAKPAEITLNVISIEDFKKVAERVTFDVLPPPTIKDGPRAPKFE